MRDTRILMDMPVIVEIVDKIATFKDIDAVYEYFHYIDETFSTFKKTSEMTRINDGVISQNEWSRDMKKVLKLSEKTKKDTDGFFEYVKNGKYDPLGLVKGWAINNAAIFLKKKGFKNFYLDAGGDIQVFGKNSEGNSWRIGIRNPFNRNENVKVLKIEDEGVATSGTYIRGQHIFSPFSPNMPITEIVSLTIVGPNIYEADRFATAAFAMGKKGLNFIEKMPGLEGYMIDSRGMATLTSGFSKYEIN
jgi:FAD:protein FMN transferase